MYCIICGYNLRGAPSDRCAECGTRFDPTNPRTYAARPSLGHRVRHHAPRLHAWLQEHFTRLHCLCCGRSLEGVTETHCPSCGSRFDRRDLTTVLRAYRFVPAPLLRFHHVAPVRGIVVPLAFVAYAVYCLAHHTAHLPGLSLQYRMLVLKGLPATMMAVAWLGAALALHAAYVWGRVEPCWRYAPLAAAAGIATALLGWGYAIVSAIGTTLA